MERDCGEAANTPISLPWPASLCLENCRALPSHNSRWQHCICFHLQRAVIPETGDPLQTPQWLPGEERKGDAEGDVTFLHN